eukprot:6718787-Alexandrium_andersonii.AAC.1
MRPDIRRPVSRPPFPPRAPGYAEACGNFSQAPQGRTPVWSIHFAGLKFSVVVNFWRCNLVT